MTQELCEQYLEERSWSVPEAGKARRRLDPETLSEIVRTMKLVPLYGELLSTDGYRPGFTPWQGKTAAAVVGAKSVRTNCVPPVPEHILQPLLATCLYLVNEVGPQLADLLEELRADVAAADELPRFTVEHLPAMQNASCTLPSPTSTATRLPTRPRSSSPHSGATRRTFRARPPARATGRRILLIASGGAADLRRVDPALLHPADRLVLNDVDPDALQYVLTHLPPATRAQTAAAPGNVLRTAAHLAADHGPFDLVLAGGLFDYLEERFTRALIRTTLSRMCRPGDTFYFSNIATPNPYAALMTHIGRWNLVERTPADIEADVRAAAPPGRNRRRTGHHRRCHRPDAFRDGAAR
ncbi:hypothetical protein ACWFRK_14955 [Streptomyces sp. NPDC055157]